MTTLLVANDGGHLMQLHTLRPRLGVGEDVVWVTPRTAQTESLLAGERVHWALPCPPRDTRALARNTVACRRLFRDHDVSLVVSTGAALALAVLPQARARRIETVYIESATRYDKPSLSGRALAMVPGITTFSQSSALTRGHWQYLASPWELYDTVLAPPRPIRSMVVEPGHPGRLRIPSAPGPARADRAARRRGAVADRRDRHLRARHRRRGSGCRRRRWRRRSVPPTSWSPTPAPASR